MNTVKAILIDPITQTITALDIANDMGALACGHVACAVMTSTDFGEGVMAWHDKHGMDMRAPTDGLTSFAGLLLLAGRVVLTGTPTAEGLTDLPLDIDCAYMSDMAQFIPAKRARKKSAGKPKAATVRGTDAAMTAH